MRHWELLLSPRAISQLKSSKVSLGRLAFHGHLSWKQSFSLVSAASYKRRVINCNKPIIILIWTLYVPVWNGIKAGLQLCCVQTVHYWSPLWHHRFSEKWVKSLNDTKNEPILIEWCLQILCSEKKKTSCADAELSQWDFDICFTWIWGANNVGFSRSRLRQKRLHLKSAWRQRLPRMRVFRLSFLALSERAAEVAECTRFAAAVWDALQRWKLCTRYISRPRIVQPPWGWDKSSFVLLPPH